MELPIRFRPAVSAQATANHTLIDLDAESQRDLLGNARTAGSTCASLTGCAGGARWRAIERWRNGVLRPRQTEHGDDLMNEQENDVADPGNGNNTPQETVFRPIW